MRSILNTDSFSGIVAQAYGNSRVFAGVVYFVLRVVNSTESNTNIESAAKLNESQRLWLEDDNSSEIVVLTLGHSGISTCWATNVIGDAGATDVQTCVDYVTFHPHQCGLYPRLQFS